MVPSYENQQRGINRRLLLSNKVSSLLFMPLCLLSTHVTLSEVDIVYGDMKVKERLCRYILCTTTMCTVYSHVAHNDIDRYYTILMTSSVSLCGKGLTPQPWLMSETR